MNSEAKIEVIESAPRRERMVSVPLNADASPMQMLAIAVQQGADIEKIRQLMDLRDRYEAGEARKAYVTAFAAFKAEAVSVIRNKTVTDGPLKGKTYAELYAVVDAVTPKLSVHGLAHSWKLSKDEKDWLEVTCTLTHVAGHSESVSFGGPPDTGGAKNPIQARASSKTYLERYTLLSILGLASKDADTDGAGPPVDTLSDEQIANVTALMQEVGADREKFLTWLKVDSLDQILAKNYKWVIKSLEKKRG